MNAGDVESLARTIDEFVLPDAQIRTPLPIDATGAEKLKQVWSMLFSVYPDIHLTVDDLIAAGGQDRRQEHRHRYPQGRIHGHPAHRKSVTYNEIFIFRFVDGRVAETWGVVDVVAQMRQIGVLSP